ncbi:hypothetical protein V8D89_008622 [Ganoderma adspersum]
MVPLLSTLLLYISTATYMAALVWNQSSSTRWAARAADGLFEFSPSGSYDAREEVAAFQDVVFRQSWMVTIATVINFAIRDAIVWWRACVIWQHKAAYAVGSLLIAVTLALGLVGVYMTAFDFDSNSRGSTILVLFISGNACAFAAVFLSLATNVLATALVACKAWKHRRLVQKHFAAAGTRSIAVVYEIDVEPLQASAGAGAAFYRAAGYITRGRSPVDAGGLSRVAQAPEDVDSDSDPSRRDSAGYQGALTASGKGKDAGTSARGPGVLPNSAFKDQSSRSAALSLVARAPIATPFHRRLAYSLRISSASENRNCRQSAQITQQFEVILEE